MALISPWLVAQDRIIIQETCRIIAMRSRTPPSRRLPRSSWGLVRHGLRRRSGPVDHSAGPLLLRKYRNPRLVNAVIACPAQDPSLGSCRP